MNNHKIADIFGLQCEETPCDNGRFFITWSIDHFGEVPEVTRAYSPLLMIQSLKLRVHRPDSVTRGELVEARLQARVKPAGGHGETIT